MKVLITAGGTREDIDDVRSLTNHSTGRLGSLIADKFAQAGAIVTYVCGEGALLPSVNVNKIIYVRTTHNLSETIENLLNTQNFDCIIHSMAVSDYTPVRIIYPKDDKNNVIPLNTNKIDSNNSEIMLVLKKTPKVISRIKTLQPKALLVGFKLLSNVTEEELLKAASGLIITNSCDIVVANDLRGINKNSHKAILIDKNGIITRADTKQEITDNLYTLINRAKRDPTMKRSE